MSLPSSLCPFSQPWPVSDTVAHLLNNYSHHLRRGAHSSPGTLSGIHDYHAVVQVAHCTRGSSQRGKLGLKTSSLSMPQTHCISPEDEGPFPNSHKFLVLWPDHMFGAQHPPTEVPMD